MLPVITISTNTDYNRDLVRDSFTILKFKKEKHSIEKCVIIGSEEEKKIIDSRGTPVPAPTLVPTATSAPVPVSVATDSDNKELFIGDIVKCLTANGSMEYKINKITKTKTGLFQLTLTKDKDTVKSISNLCTKIDKFTVSEPATTSSAPAPTPAPALELKNTSNTKQPLPMISTTDKTNDLTKMTMIIKNNSEMPFVEQSNKFNNAYDYTDYTDYTYGMAYHLNNLLDMPLYTNSNYKYIFDNYENMNSVVPSIEIIAPVPIVEEPITFDFGDYPVAISTRDIWKQKYFKYKQKYLRLRMKNKN